MGYFDGVKAEKVAQRNLVLAPTPNNVVLLRDGIHPYAEAIRAAWLGRLDGLERPWVKGAAWDNNCFVTARKLVELVNSPWAGYNLADARADYLAHAPHDQAWDKRDKCWDQAIERSGSSALPEPEPNAPLPDVTVLTLEAAVLERQPSDDPDLAELIRTRFPLLDFVDLFNTEDDGEEWIVEPLLAARRLVALYSAPKVGKSLLMLEIAVGIALGREVIGVTPEPRKVLYVDFENDPRGDVKRRLEAMGLGPEDGATLNAGLCYLSFPSLAKLDTQQGGFELLSTAQEYGCEVVVIDTVSRAVGGEENDNDTWLAFYRDTGMRLKGAGIACIRLDHSGKDLEKGMRGGSAKYGDVDAVWRLAAESETVLNLDCTDHRMPVEDDHLTLVREAYPVLHHRLVGDRTIALDHREKDIDAAIDSLHLDVRTMSANDIYKRLREAGKGGGKASVLRVVKARKLRLEPTDTAPKWFQNHPPSEVVLRTGSGTTPGTTLQDTSSPPPTWENNAHGVVPEPPQNHPEPVPGRVVPPLLRGNHPEPPPDRVEPAGDLDDLVRCSSCFGTTTAGVATRYRGLCATCHRNTGQINDGTNR